MPMNPRLLRPRSSGFNPRSIANLAAWYDAADSATLTVSTGVSAWADKSGNGRTLGQTTGNNQPISGTRTIGGKNALDFDGANDTLTCGFTIGDITSSKAFTAFSVSSSDTLTTEFAVQVWMDRTLAGDSSGWYLGRRTTRIDSNIGDGTVSGATTANVAYRRFDEATTSPGIYAVSASASSNTVRMWKNGTIKTTTLWFGTMATSAFLSQGSANHRIVVGGSSAVANSDALEHFHDGLIGEILIYSQELSTAQASAIARYLGTKWGITVA